PAHTGAPKAADTDAVAASLSDDFRTGGSTPALRAGTALTKAAHAEPEPLPVSVGAGSGPAAGHSSRLVEHPALWASAMRSRRLRGGRLVGLLVTAAAAAFAVVVFLPFSLPWNQGLHLQVQAGAYGEINTGAWVELNGARIGSVDRVESRNGFSLIRVSVEPRFAGLLHADTTAAIRPHGLLGPKFVSLQGGTTGQLGNEALIPLSRTTVSTDLEQVLNSLQPAVRANLNSIFVELGRAADGRGAAMYGAFQALGSSSADVSTTTGVLHNRADDLAALIVASEQLDRDLQSAPIDRQIADTDLVLSALVKVENSIGSGIDHTAAVTQELDTVLSGNSQ